MIAEDKFYYWGLGSTAIILMGLIIPQFGFLGLQNESYSMLNHFVSELGDIVVSEWHMIFNLSLFVGGIFMIPFILGLARYIGTTMAKISAVIGLICAVGCSLVGVYPMNYLLPHTIVSMTFFIGSIFLTIAMIITIFLQKEQKIPKWPTAVGIAALTFLGLFFSVDMSAMEGHFSGELNEMFAEFDRPAFLDIAFYEWGVVLGVLIFIAIIAIIVFKQDYRARTE